jgi:hypothetical protein
VKVTNKFLIAIVAGVVILVAVLLVLTLLNAPKYQAEDTPQGVVHNYLLALRLKDYERARNYLSPNLPGYPVDADQFAADVDLFAADINRPPYDVNWYKDDASLIVESAQINGDWASIQVRKTKLEPGDLFDNGQSSYTFYAWLQLVDGAWKIEGADRYWSDCWAYRDNPGCR